MTAIIESGTVMALSMALTGTTMRQQAIAHNIANVNTPGFKPVTVKFDSQFQEMQRALNEKGNVARTALTEHRPYFQTVEPNTSDAQVVSVDDQTAKMAENVLHHQALLKALNKHFTIMGVAVTEGKR